MDVPEEPVTDATTEVATPQERAERRANRIKLGNTVVEALRLGWEIFTHKW